MTDYTKATNFAAKDALNTGDPDKIVSGAEIDAEFTAIATAVSTKANTASPTLTGTVTLPAAGVQILSGDANYSYDIQAGTLTADRDVSFPVLTSNDSFVFEANTATLTNKTIDLTSNTLQGSKTEFNTALEADTFLMSSDLLDEDTMSSNSATAPASQQSIKAYVDAQMAAAGSVDTSGTPVANDFARFTDADTIEGRSYSEVRADLDLEVGTDVQAYSANLTALAALDSSDGNFIVGSATGWVAESGATALTSIGGAGLASPTFTGQVTLPGVISTHYQITDGAGFTIDPANGEVQYITLGASRTPVWGGANGEGCLLMVNDGTAYSITWTDSSFNSGSGPTWLNNGGSAPDLNTSFYTAIYLFQMAGTVYGLLVGNRS